MGVLTSDLLDEIKVRSFAPVSQDTFTNTKLLQIATSEMRLWVVPLLMQVREDFYLDYKDQAITASQKLYPLPERAVGNSLKAIVVVDSDSEETRLERTEVNFLGNFKATGSPSRFILRGDRVALYPTPDTTEDTLRMYYFFRTSELVETTSCAKVTAVALNGSNYDLTVDTDLTASLSAGDKVDAQNGQSPYLLWNYDLEIQTITSTTISLVASSLQDGAGSQMIGVGDYIVPRLQTCIPQLPEEYHPILAQRVAVKMLESLGDRKKWEIASADLKTMVGNVGQLVRNRVESQPQKIRGKHTVMGAINGRNL